MITLDNISTEVDGQHTVSFSDGRTFVLSHEELCAYYLHTGRTYEEDEADNLMDKILCQRAKDKCMRFVIFSKKTVYQVRKKIIELGFSEHIAELLCDELCEKGYLDDEAYCRSYVRKAAEGKSFSTNRIRIELASKGISSDIADRIINELQIDDFDSARTLLAKKLRSDTERDYNKYYAFLARKGFSGETIRKVLRETDFGEQ